MHLFPFYVSFFVFFSPIFVRNTRQIVSSNNITTDCIVTHNLLSSNVSVIAGVLSSNSFARMAEERVAVTRWNALEQLRLGLPPLSLTYRICFLLVYQQFYNITAAALHNTFKSRLYNISKVNTACKSVDDMVLCEYFNTNLLLIC